MEEVARVVLALDEHDVAEEVMHFLDRTGRARVVATASDGRQLTEAVRQLEPDAVVASPAIVDSGAELNGSALLAVDTSESVQSLRGAIRAGARGFFLWPSDRDELARATARVGPPRGRGAVNRARVVAVYGPRGGVGATFLASHLAAAFARRGRRCVLVDLDLAFGDIASAVGAPAEESRHTIADAAAIVEELAPRHVEGLLWAHPDGFRVLFAPGDGASAERVGATDVGAVLEAVRGTTDLVVLHIPRGLDDVARTGLRIADRILVVLNLDVMSFRAAKSAIDATGLDERCAFVVNRAVRREIAPRDVERVFGRAATAVIRADRAVAAAQDRGRLLPGRGRVGRAVDRLAVRLLEEEA